MSSTESTPRIACSWPGTGISTSRCAGLRKYWSICFSTSDSEARSSCTTLPMVCRSETRRYSSSIHGSSGWASRPSPTSRMRCARRCTRLPISGMVEVAVLERGVQVQHAGGHFHRQRGAGRLRRGHGLADGGLQRLGQHLAGRVQPLQRVADQRELLGQAAQAMRLAAGHRRPDFLGTGHALARLRDPGRVETAQAHGLVVEGCAGIDGVGLAHGFQPRRRGARRRAQRACAQKNSTSCARRSDTSV